MAISLWNNTLYLKRPVPPLDRINKVGSSARLITVVVYYNVQKNKAKTSYYLTLTDFLGMGTILGAGIYALIGKIAALSREYAPSSFLLSTVISVFMVFTFAELSSRYPKSAGEAVYVSQAFSQPRLSALAGWGPVQDQKPVGHIIYNALLMNKG